MSYKVVETFESVPGGRVGGRLQGKTCVQMKTTERYFLKVQFILLRKVVPSFEFADESLSVPIQMKATEHFFLSAVQGGSEFESVNEIQTCDHSKESS